MQYKVPQQHIVLYEIPKTIDKRQFLSFLMLKCVLIKVNP